MILNNLHHFLTTYRISRIDRGFSGLHHKLKIISLIEREKTNLFFTAIRSSTKSLLQIR
jgi:hypothetical protein